MREIDLRVRLREVEAAWRDADARVKDLERKIGAV